MKLWILFYILCVTNIVIPDDHNNGVQENFDNTQKNHRFKQVTSAPFRILKRFKYDRFGSRPRTQRAGNNNSFRVGVRYHNNFQPRFNNNNFRPGYKYSQPQTGFYRRNYSSGVQAGFNRQRYQTSFNIPETNYNSSFQPRFSGYRPHFKSFQPRSNSFQPRPSSFQPRSSNFQPRYRFDRFQDANTTSNFQPRFRYDRFQNANTTSNFRPGFRFNRFQPGFRHDRFQSRFESETTKYSSENRQEITYNRFRPSFERRNYTNRFQQGFKYDRFRPSFDSRRTNYTGRNQPGYRFNRFQSRFDSDNNYTRFSRFRPRFDSRLTNYSGRIRPGFVSNRFRPNFRTQGLNYTNRFQSRFRFNRYRSDFRGPARPGDDDRPAFRYDRFKQNDNYQRSNDSYYFQTPYRFRTNFRHQGNGSYRSGFRYTRRRTTYNRPRGYGQRFRIRSEHDDDDIFRPLSYYRGYGTYQKQNYDDIYPPLNITNLLLEFYNKTEQQFLDERFSRVKELWGEKVGIMTKPRPAFKFIRRSKYRPPRKFGVKYVHTRSNETSQVDARLNHTRISFAQKYSTSLNNHKPKKLAKKYDVVKIKLPPNKRRNNYFQKVRRHRKRKYFRDFARRITTRYNVEEEYQFLTMIRNKNPQIPCGLMCGFVRPDEQILKKRRVKFHQDRLKRRLRFRY